MFPTSIQLIKRNDSALGAGALGSEYYHMVFTRHRYIAKRNVLSPAKELIKRVHNSVISTAVTADYRIIKRGIGNLDLRVLLCFKIIKIDRRAFELAADLALCSHNADIASAGGKRAHRKGAGNAALKFEIYDLMVDNVIVAGINATSVIALSYRLFNVGIARLVHVSACGAEPIVALVINIELDGIIGAGVGMRTAVYTKFGRTLGLVRGAEVRERAEA